VSYLNYPASVNPDSLVGRVLGPDTAGCLYAVESAEREFDEDEVLDTPRGPECRSWTRAKVRPLYGQELIAVQQTRAVDGDGNRCLPSAKCRVRV
jgi:hypothetical protein